MRSGACPAAWYILEARGSMACSGRPCASRLHVCIQRTVPLVREGKALSFAPCCTCGRCYKCLGGTGIAVRDERHKCHPVLKCLRQTSTCVMPLCTGSLFSRENAPGWGTLILVQCPQMILCLCKCLDSLGLCRLGVKGNNQSQG